MVPINGRVTEPPAIRRCLLPPTPPENLRCTPIQPCWRVHGASAILLSLEHTVAVCPDIHRGRARGGIDRHRANYDGEGQRPLLAGVGTLKEPGIGRGIHGRLAAGSINGQVGHKADGLFAVSEYLERLTLCSGGRKLRLAPKSENASDSSGEDFAGDIGPSGPGSMRLGLLGHMGPHAGLIVAIDNQVASTIVRRWSSNGTKGRPATTWPSMASPSSSQQKSSMIPDSYSPLTLHITERSLAISRLAK